jgi:hypothetical protein
VKRDDVDVITSTFMAERTYSGARRTKVPCEGIADLPLLAFAGDSLCSDPEYDPPVVVSCGRGDWGSCNNLEVRLWRRGIRADSRAS